MTARVLSDGRTWGAKPQERVLLSSEVDPASGCWLWRRSLSKGYGRLTSGKRSVLAHRFSYEAFVGPIPVGMTIDHLCFTPKCVNPDHLVVATRLVNAKRQRSVVYNSCRRGHPRTPENTITENKGKGRLGLVCLTCRSERWSALAAHPDDRARVEAAIRHLSATGRPFSANQARSLHGVKGGVVGATFTALKNAGVITVCGDDMSDRAHGHRILQWVAAS